MGFSELKNLITEDFVLGILSDMQKKVGKGIYLLEEITLDEVIEEKEDVIEGIGKNDLGVEGHLKPLSSTSSQTVSRYSGDVPMLVSLIDETGSRVEKVVNVKVEYENEEDIDLMEYLSDFIEVACDEYAEETKGVRLESDDGDFSIQSKSSDLGNTQIFITDREEFIDAIKEKNKSTYLTEEDIRDNGVEGVVQGLKYAIQDGGTVIIEDFVVGFGGVKNFDLDCNLVDIKYVYTIREGNTNRNVKESKKLIVDKAKDKNEVISRIKKLYESIVEGVRESKFLGVLIPVNQSRYKYLRIDVGNDSGIKKAMTYMNRSGEQEKLITLIFTRKGYEAYKQAQKINEEVYINNQNNKHESDSRIRTVEQRIDKAVKESRILAKNYSKNLKCFKFSEGGRDVYVGTHYALVKQGGKLAVIYNIKEQGKSIRQAKTSTKQLGYLGNKVNVILDITDGRKKISKEDIERALDK